jgi:hypothetical protein
MQNSGKSMEKEKEVGRYLRNCGNDRLSKFLYSFLSFADIAAKACAGVIFLGSITFFVIFIPPI